MKINTGHLDADEYREYKTKVEDYFNNNTVLLYENDSNVTIGTVRYDRISETSVNYLVQWNRSNSKEVEKADIYFVLNNGLEMYVYFNGEVIKLPSRTFSELKNQ